MHNVKIKYEKGPVLQNKGERGVDASSKSGDDILHAYLMQNPLITNLTFGKHTTLVIIITLHIRHKINLWNKFITHIFNSGTETENSKLNELYSHSWIWRLFYGAHTTFLSCSRNLPLGAIPSQFLANQAFPEKVKEFVP